MKLTKGMSFSNVNAGKGANHETFAELMPLFSKYLVRFLRILDVDTFNFPAF